MASRFPWRLLAALLALGLVVAACSDSDDGEGSSDPSEAAGESGGDADADGTVTGEGSDNGGGGDIGDGGDTDSDDAGSGDAGSGDTGSDDASSDDASSGDTGSGDTAADDSGDTETDDTVLRNDAPRRIVSLSPTATEMLFAIGAGDQVIAVDSFSNFPPEAPVTDLSGFQPNIEAIAEFEPDLVVASSADDALRGGMDAIGVRLIELPAAATLEDSYAQIAELGEATGRIDGAAELNAQIRSDIDQLVAAIEPLDGLSFYHELDDTLFSATSQTFIGQIYALIGLTNIADAADPDGASGGFPQLSAEFVLDADPDLIFLADTKCCGQTAETVEARPGWSDLTAVTEGNIIELDDDIATRWGPRVVEFLGIVAEVASTVRAIAG